jgi:hypothetical protein
MKKTLVAFVLSGLWIGGSEFLRNELLFKNLWVDKYQSLGLIFPSSAINNALWAVWSFVLAGVLLYLVRNVRFIQAVSVTWITTFVMMWIVIGNMNVLPYGILWIAVPWSLVEVAVAGVISIRIAEGRTEQRS